MKYCSACGFEVHIIIPEGDNRERFVCPDCGLVHYQNPKVVTGCIPQWEDKILLCKRAIEPRYGLWTLPAGFMENQETSLEGAAREAMEEANADMREMELYCVFSIPHINQMYTMYRGVLHEGKASAGSESLEVKLVTEQDVPWDKLAFPVMTATLQWYYDDLKKGEFSTHYGEIRKTSAEKFEIERFS